MNIQMRSLREAKGLTQKELGLVVGASVRQIGYWEKGKVSLEDAAKVADMLECTLDELAGRDWPQPEYSDPRQGRINEQYDDMNELGKEKVAADVDDAHALPKYRKSAAAELDAPRAERRSA